MPREKAVDQLRPETGPGNKRENTEHDPQPLPSSHVVGFALSPVQPRALHTGILLRCAEFFKKISRFRSDHPDAALFSDQQGRLNPGKPSGHRKGNDESND